MLRLSLVHLVILCIVYVVNRGKSNSNKVNQKDLLRESYGNQIGGYLKNNWVLLLLTISPMYFFMHKPDIAEHICVIYVYHLLIRTIQNIINPTNTLIDYHTPLFIVSLLVSLQYKYIDHKYIFYTYSSVFLHYIINMHNNPQNTTTSISNDLALTHLLFYVLRPY